MHICKDYDGILRFYFGIFSQSKLGYCQYSTFGIEYLSCCLDPQCTAFVRGMNMDNYFFRI